MAADGGRADCGCIPVQPPVAEFVLMETYYVPFHA